MKTKSSFINEIQYKNKTLFVKIGKNIYEYYNVPADVAADFANAESKGAFFNQNIAGEYESQKVVA